MTNDDDEKCTVMIAPHISEIPIAIRKRSLQNTRAAAIWPLGRDATGQRPTGEKTEQKRQMQKQQCNSVDQEET